MDESVDNLLSKVTPDRRKFVQSILGLGGYAVPTVRTFLMASAIAVPALSASATTPGPTTPAPTTTRNAWRPSPTTAAPISAHRTLIPPVSRTVLKKP